MGRLFWILLVAHCNHSCPYKGWQKGQSQRWRLQQQKQISLDAAMSQGLWADSRFWKRQGTDSPLKLPERSNLVDTLILNPWDSLPFFFKALSLSSSYFSLIYQIFYFLFFYSEKWSISYHISTVSANKDVTVINNFSTLTEASKL